MQCKKLAYSKDGFFSLYRNEYGFGNIAVRAIGLSDIHSNQSLCLLHYGTYFIKIYVRASKSFEPAQELENALRFD